MKKFEFKFAGGDFSAPLTDEEALFMVWQLANHKKNVLQKKGLKKTTLFVRIDNYTHDVLEELKKIYKGDIKELYDENIGQLTPFLEMWEIAEEVQKERKNKKTFFIKENKRIIHFGITRRTEFSFIFKKN